MRDLRDGACTRHRRVPGQRRPPLAARHQDGLGAPRKLVDLAVRDQPRRRLSDGYCDQAVEVCGHPRPFGVGVEQLA
jgi:hypothetical protein